jgi:hypothetical protein
MKEVYEELKSISGILDNLNFLSKQKIEFIKRWATKDEVPFQVADDFGKLPPIIIFLPKEKALEAQDKKIKYNEDELEKHKVAAVKEMQRLIEEWT